MTNLFPFDEGETVADYRNATTLMLADVLNDNRVTRLRKVLAVYNHQAQDSAGGQMDLFTGEVKSKEDILNTVKTLLDYGTEEEQQSAVNAAVEQRKAASVQQDGIDGNSDKGDEVNNEVGRVKNPNNTGANRAAEHSVGLSDDDSVLLLNAMKESASIAPDIKLSDENWRESIDTPLGTVKMGENQREKLLAKARTNQYGMLIETLSNPDIVLEEHDKESDMFHERSSSYLFIKTFQKEDGSKYIHFESVTVSQDGMEISISSHIIRENQLKNKIKSDRLLYKATALDKPASLSAEQPANDGGSHSSVDKGSENLPNDKEIFEKIVEEEKKVDVNPTDRQKEAGNYRKGHVRIDGFDISIENPKGSERKGTDASGKPWSVTMNNTYGYIRRTEGVDGDHIDVFLSDDLDGWNGTVYVVDQVNTDGSFDEHKVMYGFNSEEEARAAYLSNYSEGWQGLGAITGVTKDEFKKWVDSSHRKTKAFAEYKSVKAVEGNERNGEKLHKRSGVSDKNAAGSSAEVALRDALVDRLRESGIDVVTDMEEGQRVLDEANSKVQMQAKKRALETASLESDSRSLTVVPSADGAKVLKNLETTIHFLPQFGIRNSEQKSW